MNGVKISIIAVLLTIPVIATLSFAKVKKNQIDGVVISQLFDKAKRNSSWKRAFITGKSEQIVFMNIAPDANPNNETGMTTHKFDQVILIAEGEGKVILNKTPSTVKSGDMIFIPQGVEHNVINEKGKKPLKIININSATEIPKKTVYNKIADVPTQD